MAGSITLVSHQQPVRAGGVGMDGVGRVVLLATADAADGSFPGVALSTLGILIDGTLVDVVTNPGSPAPDDDYDITLLDENGLDTLKGLATNRDASASEVARVGTVISRGATSTLTITGNTVVSAVITVTITYTVAIIDAPPWHFSPAKELQVADGAVLSGIQTLELATHLEDVPSASGDRGLLLLGVRNDAAAVLTDTDLDYTAIATDNAGRVKVTTTQLPAALGGTTAANSLPVTLASDGQGVTSLGSITEAAPATDTASSGLNGRLQRIAQRLTSLIALLPAALGQTTKAGSLSVTFPSDADTVAAGGNVAHDGVDSGNPVKVGGYASSAAPTAVQAADRVNAWMTLLGATVVGSFASAGADGAVGATLPSSNSVTTNPVGMAGSRFNGSTWDRERNNEPLLLLASAARTATTNSPDQTNYNGKGCSVAINVTAEAAAETLSLKIQGKDATSGNYYDIVDYGVIYNAAADAPTVTRAGIMYPGVIAADLVGISGNGAIGKAGLLPRLWRAVVTHSASGSWTYSLAAVDIV